jgi:hypothetical protein
VERELTDEQIEELASQAQVEFEGYEGDTYLISPWLTDTSPEEAAAIVQDPRYLCMCLDFGGLEIILADRLATAGLKRCLIDRNEGVRRSLERYVKGRKPKRKPGPRPKEGEHLYDRVVELRHQGISFTQIAKLIWNDPKKRNLASAHYSQAVKKQRPRLVESVGLREARTKQ